MLYIKIKKGKVIKMNTLLNFDRVVLENKHKGWTPWTQFVGFDGQNDCQYRTNGKKVQVRFLTNKIKGEACCCKDDDFNLAFGLHVAYLRCLNKALTKKKNDAERELVENEFILKKMINSLD